MTKTPEAHPSQILSVCESPTFYVVRTKAGREADAAINLFNLSTKEKPIEVYAPRVNERRSNGSKTKHVSRPLFSRYIFAAFDLEQWYLRISFTRHITSLVRFTDEFAMIQRELLEEISAQTVEGFVCLPDHQSVPHFDFAIGEIVRVIRGGWDGQVVKVVGYKDDDLILERSGPFGKPIPIFLPPYAVVAVT
jgi:transcription antitermination factor NusG